MDAEKKDNRGKKFHQKIKPYVVLQYLLKYTDENHVESGEAIAAALDENYKLSAERRSIYRDIQEINAVALMMEQECQLDKALEMLAKDPSDELRLVVYDPKQKGFYVRQRQYDLNDIRLLAECVYSAKFVSEGQAKRLVNALCGMVSEHQAEHIKHDAFLTDRVKTNNRSVLNSIDTINQAMSRRMNGAPHKPEKVSFKYMTYSIKDMHQQVERRHRVISRASTGIMLQGGGRNKIRQQHRIFPVSVGNMRCVVTLGKTGGVGQQMADLQSGIKAG